MQGFVGARQWGLAPNFLKYMEGNYLTAGELALIDQRRGYNYDGYDCGHRRGGAYGAATTGIGLAAGLGGGALLLAIAAAWGVNKASEARSRAAENLANANMNYVNQIAAFSLAEKQARETWQNANTPTIRQYVDVQTGAGAFAGAGANSQSNALAQAEATLLTQGLLGNLNQCPQKVSLYAAPQPCSCPGGC